MCLNQETKGSETSMEGLGLSIISLFTLMVNGLTSSNSTEAIWTTETYPLCFLHVVPKTVLGCFVVFAMLCPELVALLPISISFRFTGLWAEREV